MVRAKTKRWAKLLFALFVFNAGVAGVWFYSEEAGVSKETFFYWLSSGLWETASSAGKSLLEATGERVTADTEIIREYRYTGCQHVTSLPPKKEPLLAGLTRRQLLCLFPPGEGWEVIFVSPQRVIVRLNLEGLCPTDMHKRHLGVVGGRVAIFVGPVGYQAEMEELTSLEITDLPTEWQAQVLAGTLEFGDEEALVRTLREWGCLLPKLTVNLL